VSHALYLSSHNPLLVPKPGIRITNHFQELETNEIPKAQKTIDFGHARPFEPVILHKVENRIASDSKIGDRENAWDFSFHPSVGGVSLSVLSFLEGIPFGVVAW
jgi:hypothetical protein